MKTNYLTQVMVCVALVCGSTESISQIEKARVQAINHTVKTSFLHGEQHSVDIEVTGGRRNTKVVVLLRFSDLLGFYVSKNESGEAVEPTRITVDSSGKGISTTEVVKWRSQFTVNATHPKQKLAEIYIIACDVVERGDSTPSRDYQNFRYLPFNQTSGIDAALSLLRDFGWLPTGFTKIAA